MYSTNLQTFNLKDIHLEYGGLAKSKLELHINDNLFVYNLDFSPTDLVEFKSVILDFIQGGTEECTLQHWCGFLGFRKEKNDIKFILSIDSSEHPTRNQDASELLKLTYSTKIEQSELNKIVEEFTYLSDWVDMEVKKLD